MYTVHTTLIIQERKNKLRKREFRYNLRSSFECNLLKTTLCEPF